MCLVQHQLGLQYVFPFSNVFFFDIIFLPIPHTSSFSVVVYLIFGGLQVISAWMSSACCNFLVLKLFFFLRRFFQRSDLFFKSTPGSPFFFFRNSLMCRGGGGETLTFNIPSENPSIKSTVLPFLRVFDSPFSVHSQPLFFHDPYFSVFPISAPMSPFSLYLSSLKEPFSWDTAPALSLL